MSLLAAAHRLREACDALRVPGAPYVYNPLAYAWDAHAAYAQRYGDAQPAGRALLVGMNPGPWGMGQTGVPFGDVVYVRDWMRITGEHAQPTKLHPKRPVTGFSTTRREPSGSRLYGWASERFGTADAFFGRFFIANYCPLLFFDAEGKNLTPPQLGARANAAIEEACDRHLAEAIRALRPSHVVGVGQYAEERARAVLEAERLAIPVGRVLHPSPASPEANKGWAPKAEAQLRTLGIPLP
ncbi:MAG: single-strand selective monofunctional uracil glycosylase [Thermoplasmata archaeon]|nr:single-strand selective monofunctional uracil glycosylase [Thermoplasmata archaeon]